MFFKVTDLEINSDINSDNTEIKFVQIWDKICWGLVQTRRRLTDICFTKISLTVDHAGVVVLQYFSHPIAVMRKSSWILFLIRLKF